MRATDSYVRIRRLGYIGSVVAAMTAPGSNALAQKAHISDRYRECWAVSVTFKTRDEVWAAFTCRGDREGLALRALDESDANANAEVQSAVQQSVSENLTPHLLEKAYQLARTASTALRRFVGVGVIGNAMSTNLALHPADTVMGEFEVAGVKYPSWTIRRVNHSTARTSPELKAEAIRMLRELSKKAPTEDVRKRSAAVLSAEGVGPG